ncbi:hypothetical protein Rsub_05729 [Raphidocelis subcapitata]|uniref:Uncharacterized protein n=1 Tax=Raphidocelis subcapitata TaxID=307507 RepID=A0A2V0P4V9_9CHLO|nr:hypothetical protein Rsub_05729 [Raphidocelis subcapitata]|eukprot:GBF92893.1 hypothetical protein Rsub_05729 [Raphidocelis subcapitata]
MPAISQDHEQRGRPETHEQLMSSCSGLLVQRRGGATCVGLRSAFRQSIDLAAWHATQRPGVPSSDLLLATCLGKSVYNRSGGAGGGDEAAPPACIGVEWLRYREAAIAAQQRAAEAAAPSPPSALLNARSDKAAPAAAAAAGPQPAAPAAAVQDAGRSGWFGAAAERARRAAEGAVESYFGDHDPFWFAKRCADRARTNVDAMQRTAGQLAAAAMGRLPSEEDE